MGLKKYMSSNMYSNNKSIWNIKYYFSRGNIIVKRKGK